MLYYPSVVVDYHILYVYNLLLTSEYEIKKNDMSSFTQILFIYLLYKVVTLE